MRGVQYTWLVSTLEAYSTTRTRVFRTGPRGRALGREVVIKRNGREVSGDVAREGERAARGYLGYGLQRRAVEGVARQAA